MSFQARYAAVVSCCAIELNPYIVPFLNCVLNSAHSLLPILAIFACQSSLFSFIYKDVRSLYLIALTFSNAAVVAIVTIDVSQLRLSQILIQTKWEGYLRDLGIEI